MLKLCLLSLLSTTICLALSQCTVKFEGGTEESAFVNDLELYQRSSFEFENSEYIIVKEVCATRLNGDETFWMMLNNDETVNFEEKRSCDVAIARCKVGPSQSGSLQECDGKWAFKSDQGHPRFPAVTTSIECPSSGLISKSGSSGAASSGSTSSSECTLKFEGGFVDNLEFEQILPGFFVNDEYIVVKQECATQSNGDEYFWMMLNNDANPDDVQKNCDIAIGRCKVSQFGSVRQCDGKWAFKTEGTGHRIYPEIKTSINCPSSRLISNSGYSGYSGYSGAASSASSSCVTVMKLTGNEMVNGLEWNKVEDAAKEFGEAEYYYISKDDEYRLYKEDCAMTVRDQYFWIIVEAEQDIARDCNLAIGRCKAWDLKMCDGAIREWAFKGEDEEGQSTHIQDAAVKIEFEGIECR